MKDTITIVLLATICLVALLGAVWAIQGNHFFMYKLFAPQYEQVRREVFEQSKAYNQGMIQELQNMQFQWLQASPEHRAALTDIILHRAADFDQTKLSNELKQFISGLRSSLNHKEAFSK